MVPYPPPDFWALAHESLRSGGVVDDVRLGGPSNCPPSPTPRAAAASPLNAREPEPKPRLALRQPQHPGPPQSPYVTSDCPITEAPAHIKGAGHASRLPRRLRECQRRWDWVPRARVGVEREFSPLEERGWEHPPWSGCRDSA